jgi:hypothetical protein
VPVEGAVVVEAIMARVVARGLLGLPPAVMRVLVGAPSVAGSGDCVQVDLGGHCH